MNPTSSARAPVTIKPTNAPKRRGRPRSPVFGYFQRIVSESGEFQGNKCRFCAFTSRDRSENPTYLTRHILRSCDAPQEVKDAMGARQLASPGTTSRGSLQKATGFSSAQDPTPPALGSRSQPSEIGRPDPESSHLRQNDVGCRRRDRTSTLQLPAASSVTSAPGASLDAQQSQASKQRSQTNQLINQGLEHPEQSHPEAGAVPSAATRTIVQSRGVTKSRRGRPRSQALLHFRRHVDEKGNFIANQCSHCTFVSRDRSENSTLLLRHLLSQACGAPETVRVVLRGNRYTVDGKRTSRSEGVGSETGRRTGSKAAGVRATGDKVESHGRRAGAVSVLKFSPENFDVMATAIVRFFVRHAIDFRAAESKLFADLLESAAISQGTNERIDQGFADSKKLQHCSGVPERYTIPHGNALQAFWEHSPAAQFVDTDLSNIGEFPSSRYLIIYFPDYANAQPSRHALRRQPTEDEGNSGEASMIASTFLWTSGAKLYYIGSRNCSHDFKSCIAELVLQSQETCKLGKAALDQVFIGRPFETSEQSADVTKNDPVNTWISDVPREVDILAQQLLTQVPVLSRCVRRNTLLASFFRETYSSRAAVMLFGRNLAEKEQCARYKAHIALPLQLTRCCDAVENAQQTFKILSHAQSSHKDRQRFQETSSFLHTINEESAGNVQLCQEITRLVLSQPYLNELEIFIAVMKPLAKLIEKYTCVDDSLSANDMGSSAPLASGGRSLAHVLPDCFSTLRDIYKEQRPELENDLRLLRAMSARRLMGQGGDEYPPIVGDICYLATFLNPTSDLAAMKGITVDESWRRAVSFLHFQYGSRSDVVLDRAIEQLQDFHQRSGAFAEPGIFIAPDETEQEDPRIWWQKHGRLAPDLFTIALKVLDAPTAAFPIVKLASEMNGRHSDLYSTEKDELMEKKRFLLWNLRLSERADKSKNVDSFLGPPHSKGES